MVKFSQIYEKLIYKLNLVKVKEAKSHVKYQSSLVPCIFQPPLSAYLGQP